MIVELTGSRWQEPAPQMRWTLYKKLHPNDSPSYLLADIVTDFWMRQAANRVAELKAKQAGAPVFVYVLEWEVDSDLRYAAWHG